jgi:hypothetical protein
MTTSDPTTPGEHDDYRIVAISDALTEHRHSWATMTDDGIAFDTDLAGIIAVAAIEASMEEDELTGRICRHVCHDVEREDNIKAIRLYAEQVPEYKVLVEQLVLMIMDEGK